MSQDRMTTAAALLSFRKELADGGMAPDLCDALTVEAAHAAMKYDEGIYVRGEVAE